VYTVLLVSLDGPFLIALRLVTLALKKGKTRETSNTGHTR
jgi:hypothetical protein